MFELAVTPGPGVNLTKATSFPVFTLKDTTHRKEGCEQRWDTSCGDLKTSHPNTTVATATPVFGAASEEVVTDLTH